jgi:hypothetical protein
MVGGIRRNQSRTFDRVKYENWGVGFRTEQAAAKEGGDNILEQFITHFKVTKSTDKSDPKPYQLWVHNDIKTVWDRHKSKVRLDPGMKAIIFDLNAQGMYTVDCCSGHGTHRGHIFFYKPTANQEKLLRIMREHGLKNIKKGRSYSETTTYYSFDTIVKKGG